MQEKKNVFKEIAYWSKIIVLGVVLGTGLQFASAVWTDPTPGVTPPDQSVVGPITTGVGQTKNGNLVLNPDAGLVNGLIVTRGNVGIGTVNPQANIQIGDNFTMSQRDGNKNTIIANNMNLAANGWSVANNGWRYLNNGPSSMMWMGAIDSASNGGDFEFVTYPSGSAGGVVPSANGNVMVMKNNGNVGIGTTAPSTGLKLDVEGKVGATQYCDQNGNNCVGAPFVGERGPAGPQGPAGPSVSFYCIEITTGCPSGTVKMRNVDPVSGDAATSISTCCGVK